MATNELQSSATGAKVSFQDGQGDLPMLAITTPWSNANVYLHGAHVTHFQKHGEPPLLFMSQCSRFSDGQPIRGGVPIILPWFGMREGLGQHGFARNKDWALKEVAPGPNGSARVKFRLPDYPEASSFPSFSAELVMTVSDCLMMELAVTNESHETLVFENCLHTYFEVGDVTAITISGLKGVCYLDQVENFAQKTENEDSIRISSQVDRIYLNTTGPVEITDPRLGRKIRIEKHASLSTVVWNPWAAKAQQMPDFGNDEFQRMVCVESGNVASNQIKLPPGESSKLRVTVTSQKLA